MNLNEKTINALKSLSTVNPSILVREGNVLRSMSPLKTIYAKASVPDNFTKRFAIYDLSQFIGIHSTFDKPSVEFNDTFLTISDNKRDLNFFYAAEETIKVAAEKDPSLPSVDATFNFNTESLKEIVKGAGILKLPDIAFVGDGQTISVQAINHKENSSNVYRERIGQSDKVFRAVFKVENITKIISGEYNVEISTRGISHFIGNDVEYWIAVEAFS
jgi:hypothetical protein